MNVTITPDSEANYILSSVAASRLKLKSDVALTGESERFRQALKYYSLSGLQDTPLAGRVLSLLRDDAISCSLTKASTLDRICAMTDCDPVKVVRPVKLNPTMSDPIIFDDSQPSGSESNKEPESV